MNIQSQNISPFRPFNSTTNCGAVSGLSCYTSSRPTDAFALYFRTRLATSFLTLFRSSETAVWMQRHYSNSSVFWPNQSTIYKYSRFDIQFEVLNIRQNIVVLKKLAYIVPVSADWLVRGRKYSMGLNSPDFFSNKCWFPMLKSISTAQIFSCLKHFFFVLFTLGWSNENYKGASF